MSHARVAPELSWFWRLLGLYGERAATARELLAAVGAEPPAGLAEEYVLCVINALPGESGDPADQRCLARVEDVLADLSRPLRLPFTVVLWSVVGGPRPATNDRVRVQIGGDAWGRAPLESASASRSSSPGVRRRPRSRSHGL